MFSTHFIDKLEFLKSTNYPHLPQQYEKVGKEGSG